METPLYRLRLSKELQKKVVAIGKIYGAPNTSVFVRELLVAVCGGDLSAAQAFQSRLAEKLTGQMQLELVAAQERAARAQQPHQKRRSRVKGGRHAA